MTLDLFLTIAGLSITLIVTIAGAVWFLSTQLHDLHQSIDKIGDNLREYILINDNSVRIERDRITALKYNYRDKFNYLNERITNIEDFIAAYDFKKRRSFISSKDTQNSEEYFKDENESQLME